MDKTYPMAWPLKITPAKEGGYFASFPDWPANFTEGETRAEVMEMAADLLETMVSSAVARDEPIPAPSPAKRRPLIYLSPLSAAKVRLREALKAAGLRQADLARRLKQTPQQTGRLFDLRHKSDLAQLEAAFRALGKQIVIDVKDAA